MTDDLTPNNIITLRQARDKPSTPQTPKTADEMMNFIESGNPGFYDLENLHAIVDKHIKNATQPKLTLVKC